MRHLVVVRAVEAKEQHWAALVESMASGILVVVEHEGGQPKKTAYELLTKARELAAGLGGSVSAVVVGSDSSANLGEYGAEKVYTVSGSSFETYGTEAYTAALSAVLDQAQPAVVLAPASAASRDYFPRVAARKGLGMASEVTELSADGGSLQGKRPVYAGKALVSVSVSSTPALYT